MRIYLKSTPPGCFGGKIAKIFGAAIFSKHQRVDASEDSDSLFLEHQRRPPYVPKSAHL